MQARHEVERHREALQRQMAGLDGQLHVSHARLQDALADHHVCACHSLSSRMSSSLFLKLC